MAETADPFKREEFLSVPRKHDLDIRVSRVTIEDESFEPKTYVDVREFIPSINQYGRGILLPVRHLDEILAAMKEAGDVAGA